MEYLIPNCRHCQEKYNPSTEMKLVDVRRENMYRPKVQILAVEDEVQVRRIYERIISDAGYTIKAVGTYEEAINELQSGVYHVVIVDLNLTDQGDDLGMNLLAFIQDNHMDDVIG